MVKGLGKNERPPSSWYHNACSQSVVVSDRPQTASGEPISLRKPNLPAMVCVLNHRRRRNPDRLYSSQGAHRGLVGDG